jgi:hypothetical protein
MQPAAGWTAFPEAILHKSSVPMISTVAVDCSPGFAPVFFLPVFVVRPGFAGRVLQPF